MGQKSCRPARGPAYRHIFYADNVIDCVGLGHWGFRFHKTVFDWSILPQSAVSSSFFWIEMEIAWAAKERASFLHEPKTGLLFRYWAQTKVAIVSIVFPNYISKNSWGWVPVADYNVSTGSRSCIFLACFPATWTILFPPCQDSKLEVNWHMQTEQLNSDPILKLLALGANQCELIRCCFFLLAP